MARKSKLPACLPALAALWVSLPASAALPARWGAGALLGLSKPSDMGFGIQYGLEFNIPVTPTISAVAMYQKTSQSLALAGTASSFDVSRDLSLMGGGAIYQFNPSISAGLKLGIAKTQSVAVATSGTSTISSATDGSGLFLQPVVIYEKVISGGVTLAGELGYVHTLSDAVPRELTLLAAVKYWF